MENNRLQYHRIQQGKVLFEPTYLEQVLDEYRDNPFIEALPPIFGDEEIINRFRIYPLINDEEKNLNSNIRYHMIKRLKNFVQPLNVHFEIERKISTMIRRGYIARNPMSKEYLERLRYINSVQSQGKDKLDKLNELSETLRSTAESYSIIGISGIGKTTAIERILMMYPQVILHNEYKGQPLTRTQVVWLKIDCPYDGSIKTLCKIFFRALDDVLGTTNYFNKFGSNRISAATMMIHMSRLASIHSIGVLVIDELQHLINKKNNSDEMLNFLVTLVNTTGVPTILVGTPKAKKVLAKDFRQARRAEGIAWDRMESDEEWDFFLETLWDFQWLREFTPLTESLSKAMYDECQGITSVAVNLFILIQERALASGLEKITIGMIRDVAKKELKMIRKMILALKKNNIKEISKYDDIVIDLEGILGNTKQEINLRGKIEKLAKQDKRIRHEVKIDLKDNIISEIVALGIFKHLKYNDLDRILDQAIKESNSNDSVEIKQKAIALALQKESEVVSRKKTIIKKDRNYKDNDIRKIYEIAIKKKILTYEALKEEGFIKNPMDEFMDIV